jgi:hypothetical protein
MDLTLVPEAAGVRKSGTTSADILFGACHSEIIGQENRWQVFIACYSRQLLAFSSRSYQSSWVKHGGGWGITLS